MPHPESGLRDDVLTLRRRLREAGYYERPFWPVLWRWLLHVALGVGGLAAFVLLDPWPLRALAMLVSCFGFLGTATLGHTASHGAASEGRIGNAILLYVTYPFFLMLSATYWHHSHVQVHHPAPNVVGHDDDCDLRPVFALNEQHAAGASGPGRALLRAQGFLLPVLLPFNGFSMHRQAWQHLIGVLLGRQGARRPAAWLDLACMSLHIAVWIVLPMLWFSPVDVLLVYAVRVALMGTGLFAILAPGHFPADARCLDASQKNAGSFYLRQTATTVNFEPGPLGAFVCSGLQYQIEHHLFPSISHVHLAKIAPLVRELCERHRLPYRSMPWSRAIWESYMVFFRPKPVHADIETLRESCAARAIAEPSHPPPPTPDFGPELVPSGES
jgi:linoleoyl-CoA desaturase